MIIDNGSTDGSAEYFDSIGAKIIKNGANYSYPYCQNKGIEIANYDYLAFLNNDIIVSPHWDLRLMDNMKRNDLVISTGCGIENIENRHETRRLKNRWKLYRNLLKVFGHSVFNLKLTHRLMYGNWEQFCDSRYDKFKGMTKEGFVGSAILMRRNAIEKVGLWDERIQAADYDLYLRSKKRAIEFRDMKPMMICLDVFIHHYIRITLNAKPPEFIDRKNLIPLKQKWGENYLKYLKHIDD
ncbi:MAG: glycosyltransferase [Thermodesulfovibrionales bacterium]|nr:glycosyltransferase [Thermodesulfovibrionales bacterium]